MHPPGGKVTKEYHCIPRLAYDPLDGEPAVGLMLQVKDLSNDQVVYSAAGGRTGGSREALAAVGQRLAAELVSGIRIESTARPATSR